MSQPNASELAVLKHLWSAGPQSAREVHDAIGPGQGWKPSTTRTVIARMEEKGWVARKDVHGMAVFSAVLDRTATLGGLVRHLARQVLDMDGQRVDKVLVTSLAAPAEDQEASAEDTSWLRTERDGAAAGKEPL